MLPKTVCGKGKEVFCLVDMKKLNIESNQVVIGRVSAPDYGWEHPSLPNTEGARMLGLPIKMAAPEYTLNDDIAKFSWEAMHNVSRYELWMED